MRLENANNLQMGTKFMIAIWVKLHVTWGYGISNYEFISQRRYDNGMYPIYALGMSKLIIVY